MGESDIKGVRVSRDEKWLDCKNKEMSKKLL